MTTHKATTKETSDSIAFFLGLSQAFTVDDDGYVVYLHDPEKRAMIKGNGPNDPKRALVIYQERMPVNNDYYTVNPYAEGLGLTTPPNSFFYSTLRLDLVGRLIAISESMIMFMMHQKGIPVPETEYTVIGAPKVLLDIASTKDSKGTAIGELVDEKTLTNIRSFLRPTIPGKPGQHGTFKDLAYVAYTKNLMTASLKIDLLSEPNYQDTIDLKKMRKVDFQVLRGILMGALRIKDVSELDTFTAAALPDTPPKMSAWLAVLFKVYQRINEALMAIDEDCVVPLGEFDHHLKNLSAYYLNARWQVQMTNHRAPETNTTIPGGAQSMMPAATAQTPGISTQSSTMPQQMPGTSLMPGAIRADGSVAPPQAFNTYGQTPFQTPSGNIPAPISLNQYPQQGYPQPGMPQPQQPQQYMTQPGMPGPIMMQPGMMPQPGMPQYPQPMGYAGYPQPGMPQMGYAAGYGQPVSSGNPPFYGMIAGGAAGGSLNGGYVGVR